MTFIASLSMSMNGTAHPPRNKVAAMRCKRAGGRELTDEEQQEPEPAVLGEVAGDDLGLGDRHVEGRLCQLGLRRDQEHDEPDELREDVRVADAAPTEDRAVVLGDDDAVAC